MSRLFLFFCLIALFGSCNKDEDSPEEDFEAGCLDVFPRLAKDPDCATFISDSMATSDMDLVYVGDSELTESSKATFSDFCLGSGSSITFEDANENETEFLLTFKTFHERNIRYTIGNMIYCMDVDFARISLTSDQYTFRIYLTNGLRDGFHLTEDYNSSNVIAYHIWVKNVDRVGYFTDPQIYLPIEDHLQNSIETDTGALNHYNSIFLNQKEFTDIITDEDITDHRMYNRPTVYFHRTQGIVGFIDDQGVLWNRK